MLIPRKSTQAKRVNAFIEVRRSRIHGQGLFSRRLIRKGARLIEYVGEKVTKAESNRRGLALYERSKATGGASVFIFELNETHDLDGEKSYNPARLANHSCDPNCEFVNENDQLYLYALRDIAKGEEITFDYGYDMAHFLEHPCRCGADNCVGFIVRTDQRPKLKRLLMRKAAVGKKRTK